MSDSSQGGPLAYPALPNFRGAGEIPFSRLRAYQHFILRNAPRVAAVERISRGLAFTSGGVVALLDHTSWKGRFGDNLYLQEFALMVINIVANFHTAVFSLSGLFKPSKMTPLHTRLQNAFFRAQLKRLGNDSTYGMLILAFQLITYVEKVAEISLAKRGEDVKWNGIVAIEVVK